MEAEQELGYSPVGKTSKSSTVKDFFKLKGSYTNLFYVISGEFIGTFIFLWTAYMIASAANLGNLGKDYTDGSSAARTIMIAFGFGFGVMIGITLTAKISGGNLNPAVTLTLIFARAVDPIKGFCMMCSQIIAGMAAGGAVSAMTPGPVTFANALNNDCSRSRGLMIEAFATALLCVTVLMTVIEKSSFNDFASVLIGISLFLGHLVSINYTGAGLNPARSLGAAVAKRSFPTYFWIYWIGPIIGSIIAAGIWYFWAIIKPTEEDEKLD
jgi:aquaporin related protein